jgi:anti-sigma regulatory factor (Ser/Thr protein kinase)
VQEQLDDMGRSHPTDLMRMMISLQEALSNALYHGNLEIDPSLRRRDERAYREIAERRRAAEPYRSRRIRVHLLVSPSEIRFVVRDEGPGFDTSRIDRPIEPDDLIRLQGRGLFLIRTFMDEIRFNGSGNEITLIKTNAPPHDEG